MDQPRYETPSKRESSCESATMLSPRLYKTPVKQAEVRYTAYQRSTGCFTVLPSHITPPSGLTKFIARNPFEPDLTNRLHLSMISPTVFSKVSSPSQNSPGFAWNVEELALIQPAKIEEYPVQQAHCLDPEVEVQAQAAIDRFFKENQIIPSPWEITKKESKLKSKIHTPVGVFNGSNLRAESPRSKKEGWSQTVLSLPPELPPHIEEALKPYFTFTQGQNTENEDANLSNNSLRRKLFFNHDDDCQEHDDDNDSSICVSPVKMSDSLAMPSSPPQSGMLIHAGTPLKYTQRMQRTHGTPLAVSDNLSPPNVSPIHNTIHNMSCESLRSRSRSVVRLDFTTDMSIDQSVLPARATDEKETCYTGEANRTQEMEKQDHDSTCVQPSLKDPLTSCRSSGEAVPGEAASQKLGLTEPCRAIWPRDTTENVSDQQSGHQSVQDTGYQTGYSISMNGTDSCDVTPAKQKLYWGDRIARTTEAELRLSDWKGNMQNIFSSTPSRNREKDSHVF